MCVLGVVDMMPTCIFIELKPSLTQHTILGFYWIAFLHSVRSLPDNKQNRLGIDDANGFFSISVFATPSLYIRVNLLSLFCLSFLAILDKFRRERARIF